MNVQIMNNSFSGVSRGFFNNCFRAQTIFSHGRTRSVNRKANVLQRFWHVFTPSSSLPRRAAGVERVGMSLTDRALSASRFALAFALPLSLRLPRRSSSSILNRLGLYQWRRSCTLIENNFLLSHVSKKQIGD